MSDRVEPKTSCLFRSIYKTGVACDDYIRKDGSRTTLCCKACGWNPVVAEKRKEELRKNGLPIKA